MDKIVSVIAGLGIPGLVLLTAMGTTGFAGGAAITTALAVLGPFGIPGGIATLGLIGFISKGITEYGLAAIVGAVVRKLINEGESTSSILKKIEAYPLSPTLKRKIREEIAKC